MKVLSTTKHLVAPAQPAPPGTVVILTNNDQVMPRMYTNMLYYFSPTKHETSGEDFMSTDVLKKSLAETLSLFYPLAGRYRERANGGLDIECTNEKVELHEAVVDEDFATEFEGWQPTPASQVFLPAFDWSNPPSITATALLQTQLTRFKSGKVCLAVAVHHNVCDGPSVASFVSAWANKASGNGIESQPLLDRQLLKSRDPPKPTFDHTEFQLHPPTFPGSPFPTMIGKRFEFDPDRLKKLKETAGLRDDGGSFSSFEVLSGHVWKFVTKARELEGEKEIKLGFAVDGRRRFDPPLPDSYVGNVNFFGLATSTAGDLVSKPVGYAANRVHEAISRITDEYMRSSLDWVGEQENPTGIFPSFHTYLGPDFAITSWSRFPAYEVDFGWGTPEFFSIKDCAWDGLAILLPSSKPGCINVLVGLTVQAMDNLQADPEFHP